jgi:hypothetical protein
MELRHIWDYQAADNTNYKTYVDSPGGGDSQANSWAYAKAYERFKQAVKGDTSEMAVNLAERKQAIEMIAKRGAQLLKFTQAVRRFRWADAEDALGVPRDDPNVRRKLKRRAKSFGKNWLEYHFGWSPLIGDIGNSLDLLCRGLPAYRVRASASARRTWESRDGTGTSTVARKHDVTAKYILGADVQVSNPNILLLNQMGFVNPLTVAWELVPFSFVVDWFVNVSDVLGSFTEFWGLSLQRPFYTINSSYLRYNDYILHPRRERWWSQNVYVERYPATPPGPALKLRAPWRLSTTRALTSVSLLVQHLR